MSSFARYLVVGALSLTPLNAQAHSRCRFSPVYSQEQIRANATAFQNDMLFWESGFGGTNGVGYNPDNGMTYDGVILNQTTGIANISERHPFSAASKESLQVMVLAHAIAGDPRAMLFVSPSESAAATPLAANILSNKLQSYLAFNSSYPGFGGYLPWFLSNDTTLQPTSDFVNRVPGLDNGELLWAVYGLVEVLESSNDTSLQQLGTAWEAWLNYTKATAAPIFYHYNNGSVCAVATLNQTQLPTSLAANYSCEGYNFLNDPYEGELFTWWLYFFSNLTQAQKDQLWEVKRPQLVAFKYTGLVINTSFSDSIATNYSGLPVLNSSNPITVQNGFWFSSHEQWKLLEMPYLDIPLVYRIFHNAECVRTCNSVLMGQNSGMFASVNNITDPITGQIDGYISYAGTPSVANQTTQELDVVTPYSVFPTLLFNTSVGLAWYKNMLDGKGMQNLYGSSEALRRDGTGVSAFVSWDSKITTIVALLGGVGEFVGRRMKREGLYDEFVRVLTREYGMVFNESMGGSGLVGENVDLCYPDFQVPVVNVTDFETCR
ncbi:hypothetical protein LTR66_015704 [Elasticomyces elasticus]|nr:hypothetical protein LTR66_015704 [Elasticomyces elasticus]